MYGGEVVYFSGDYTNEIDIEELEKFLQKENDFKYATVVHCDTPTGVLNDLSKICPLLKRYNILTVVDSVAAMVGEEIRVDDWQIDIALGGSQKAISAPTQTSSIFPLTSPNPAPPQNPGAKKHPTRGTEPILTKKSLHKNPPKSADLTLSPKT